MDAVASQAEWLDDAEELPTTLEQVVILHGRGPRIIDGKHWGYARIANALHHGPYRPLCETS